MDDCWYGYNCRTQVHKYAHAGKLNVSAVVIRAKLRMRFDL